MTGINYIAGHSPLREQLLELVIVLGERVKAERIGVGHDDKFVRVLAGHIFRRRPLRRERRAHYRGELGRLDLQNRRQSAVLHNPKNRVARVIKFIDPVGRRELRLYRPAVAVADILGHDNDPPVLVDGRPAVLHGHEIFRLLVRERIILRFIEIRLFQTNRGRVVVGNNKRVVV